MNNWINKPGSGLWRGEKGIRSGGRVFIFLFFVAIIQTALFGSCSIFYGVLFKLSSFFPHQLQAVVYNSYEIIKINFILVVAEISLLIAAFSATKIMAKIEDKSISEYYLFSKNKLKLYFFGIFWGAIASFFVFFALYILFPKSFLVRNSFYHLYLTLIYDFFLFSLFGIVEEVLFRGYALKTLKKNIGFWPASLITSAAFMLFHSQKFDSDIFSSNQLILLFVEYFLAGIFLSCAVRRTGSLFWSIGFHGIWDFLVNFLTGYLFVGLSLKYNSLVGSEICIFTVIVGIFLLSFGK